MTARFIAFLLVLPACGFLGYEQTASPAPDNRAPGTCNDQTLNNLEEKIDCGGPNCNPCLKADARSCKALLQNKPDATSGPYVLDTNDQDTLPPYQSYCEMFADGGGWTLALKTDGTLLTFDYDSYLWVNDELYHPESTTLEAQEAKLQSFLELPARELRVGMRYNGQTHWIVVPLNLDPPQTLQQIFLSNMYIPTSMGSAAWLSLIDGAGIQTRCNIEGLNISNQGDIMHTRLGIIGDENTDDCSTSDSFVGFGASAPRTSCSSGGGFLTGTGNGWGCDDLQPDTLRDFAAIGYIFVRE